MKRLKHAALFVTILILCLSRFNYFAFAQTTWQPESFATQTLPVGLVWTGTNFIASYRDNATRLVSISADGKQVTPFAPSFSAVQFPSIEDYIALSNGSAGFPKGFLYMSAANQIFQLDPTGTNVEVFATIPQGLDIGYLAFDTEGAWGHLLYALTVNGSLWSINSTGSSKMVASFGSGVVYEGFAVAPPGFGTFGGDMLISNEKLQQVMAINQSDPNTPVPFAKFQGEAPERVIFIQNNSDLYVAMYVKGVIGKVPASMFSNFTGPLLVITEGEAGQNGSLWSVSAKGSNVTETRVVVDSSDPHFEGAVFVPLASISSTSSRTSSSTTSLSISTTASSSLQTSTPVSISSTSTVISEPTLLSSSSIIIAIAVAIFVILVAVVLIVRRGK